ncbi:MAG: hypothetical protein KJ767_02220, partial [Nanoarchaeota archaeon]|nr:hypothetical protein [Nanoarchaeota archaeon]
ATYPQPFVSSAGVADVAVIVGSGAAAEDIIASNDIVASLVVPTGSGTSTTVSGGEVKDIPLNTALNDGTQGWGASLDDSEVESLFDGEINIQIEDVSDDYNVHEEIELGSGIVVETGLTATSPSEEFKDVVFLEVAEDSVKYRYVFDENLKAGNYLANASTDDPVKLDILGKEIEITGATATSLTALVGDKFTLAVGESKDVGGKTLTLVEVGSDGSINVDVEGDKEIIGSGNTKTVGTLRVKNHARIYTTATAGVSQATIIAGSKTSDTFTSGDEFIGEDENDPNWVWELGGLDTSAPTINVSYNRNLRDYRESDPDAVIYEGTKFNLPNDYVSIELTGFTEGSWRDYTFNTDTTRLRNASGTGADLIVGSKSTFNVLKVSADDGEDDSININCVGVSGTPFETDTIYIYANNTQSGPRIYWEDKNQDTFTDNPRYCSQATGEPTNFTLHNSDSDIVVWVHENLSNVGHYVLDFRYADGGTTLRMPFNLSVNKTSPNSLETEWFGLEEGDAKTGDIVVGTRSIGTWEENTLTQDGIRIYDPESYNDEFHVGIPTDDRDNFEMNVAISGEGATISRTGTSVTRAPVGVSYLDTEITSVQGKNIVAIGGSGINRVSAKILGLTYPTYGTDQAWQDSTGVTGEGQAVVKLVDSPYTTGKVAMIVAGWSAVDTRRAGKAVAQNVPALSGKEALLSTVSSTVTKL